MPSWGTGLVFNLFNKKKKVGEKPENTWVRLTSEVSKFAGFFMSAARTWVCPIALVVMTIPLVLTVATEVLDDVQMYIPLPPDGCKEQWTRTNHTSEQRNILWKGCITL